jgi:hypothetical protein
MGGKLLERLENNSGLTFNIKHLWKILNQPLLV